MSLPKSLCIYSIADPYKESWCFSDQRIAEEDVIYMKFNREKQRKFDLKMDIFKNLQKLCLYSIGEKINDFLEELNCLTKLEVLMIWDGPAKRIKLRKLSSTSLRKLSIRNSACQSMELDTPNLHSFALYYCGREREVVNFGFPLKIKHLECTKFTLRLSHLKNLETLLCEEITFDFKLKDFKSLVKLEIFPRDANELEFVKGLQEERTRLGRDRLEIIVSGFKEQLVLGGRRAYSSDYELTPSYVQHALQNSSNLVGRMPQDWEIGILTLLEYANSIPRSLLDKIRIGSISIHYNRSEKGYRLTDTEQSNLAEFIKLSEPDFLDFSCMNLNREFYEQICEVQSIGALVIGHWSEPYLETLEFESFLKLKNLSALRVYCFNEKIPLKFLCELVQLKSFIYFHYQSSRSLGTGCEIMIDYYVFDCDLIPEGHDEPDEEAEFLMTSPYYLKFYRSNKIGSFEMLFSAFAKDPHELARELTKLIEYEESKNCLIY